MTLRGVLGVSRSACAGWVPGGCRYGYRTGMGRYGVWYGMGWGQGTGSI